MYNKTIIEFGFRMIPSASADNTTGNPGSLCVGKYREHMRRSLGLKIC